ncbi:class A beta-lactamase-related serine hydrolase [Meiothermus sp. QL-1]|uniref:serine hydrolase domain-containing protein n=1 Tax=Meiothermus sp. QL-1 TaxID=2058095 RepID=UPI000E0A16AE|nr:serine hydrolase domain-containing protein [Meiothermus sp. QL-1]RDI94998.1 class A beta-lactamase-related serine hydrolase [Meiothermus sp. QL-1]
MRILVRGLGFLLLGLTAALAQVQEGVDLGRLAAFKARLEVEVAQGRLPGAVFLVARNGQVVYHEAVGYLDPQARTPMTREAIFRIYSMTKPLTSVLALSLAEEGRLFLTDPIALYLPEFREVRVGVERTAEGRTTLELVPAQRPITLYDLLRHTSGFTYGIFFDSLVKQEYRRVGADAIDQTAEEFVGKLARLPLQFQPGTVWEYSNATDLLGHLLERVTGRSLAELLEERIFRPLGMGDTGFQVPREKWGRIAEPFATDPFTRSPTPQALNVRETPKRFSGGAGAVSTALDYFRFLQALLNGGELEGRRILSPKSVALMTADHLGPLYLPSLQRGAPYLPGPGYGFGLGVAVRLADGGSPLMGSAGEYNWGGLFGTSFFVDPKERLVAVWMMQNPGGRAYYAQLFRTAVYASLVR